VNHPFVDVRRSIPGGPRLGTFTYDSTLRAEFDGGLLAHVQLVLGSKLHRNEWLFFSRPKPVELDGGRTTVRVNPSVPLFFDHTPQTMSEMNREWVDELSKSASSNLGRHLVDDPPERTEVETLSQRNLL